MKRIVISVVALIMMLMAYTNSTYAVENNEIDLESGMGSDNLEEMQPYYVSAQIVKIGFTIQTGKAICSSQVTPKTTTAITSVKGNFKIINSAGKTVKTYNQNLKKSGNNYYFSETYQLPSKGTYYMKATLTCYKNGVKQETVSKTSAKKTY